MPRKLSNPGPGRTLTAASFAAVLACLTVLSSAAARPSGCQSGRIVFSRFSETGPDIYSMNPCGGGVRRLTFRGGHFAKVSPDGKLIAFSGPGLGASDIWTMHADGSDLRDVTNSPDQNDAFPAWSPDGRELAFSAEAPGSRAGQLFVLDLRSGVAHAVTQPFQPREPGDPSWSPDGRHIVFDEFAEPPALGQLWIVDSSGRDLRAVTPRDLDAFAPDWSSTGVIAFSSGASSPQSHLWTMQGDGSGLRELTTDPEGSSSELPAFSPSGEWLTYTHILASGASSIWKVKVSGADPTTLTTGPADEYSDWGSAG